MGARVYRVALVAAYDGPFGPAGRVISRHTTLALAERAERRIPKGSRCWVRLRDLTVYALMTDPRAVA